MWMIASDVDNDKKVIVFLSVIGANVYRLLKNFLSPDKPSPKTYKELCDALREHYKPIVIVERFRFQRRNQQDGELVADYLVALRQLSTDCAHLNDALHHWFVSRLKSEDVQKKLIKARANVQGRMRNSISNGDGIMRCTGIFWQAEGM